MEEKPRLKIFNFFNILLTVLLCSICNSLLIAQQKNNFNDQRYKYRVLQKIDSLLKAKYVLPEKAKEYAGEFNKKYESGYYKSYTNSKEFV